MTVPSEAAGFVGEGVGDRRGVGDRFAQFGARDRFGFDLYEVNAGAAVDVEVVFFDRVVAVGEHVEACGLIGHLEICVLLASPPPWMS